MDITEYIKPGLLLLVPALNVLGAFIKDSHIIKDKYIPLFLCGVSVLLAVAWLLATTPLTGWQSILLAGFTAATQGILCAGAAVLGSQIVKQAGKDE